MSKQGDAVDALSKIPVDDLAKRALAEAERRVDQGEGLHYDMEVDAFVAGALWASGQDKH